MDSLSTVLRSYLVLTVWYAWWRSHWFRPVVGRHGKVWGPESRYLLWIVRWLRLDLVLSDVGRHGRVLRAKSLVKVLRRRQHPGPLVMAHWLATFVATLGVSSYNMG